MKTRLYSPVYSFALFFQLLSFSFLVKAQPTWEAHIPDFGDTIFVSDIHIVNENVIWAVGLKYMVAAGYYDIPPGNPYYAKTTDGGTTWTTGIVPLAPDNTVCYVGNITAIDSMTAYLVGLESPFGADDHNGKTLKTIDGGTTWTELDVGWNPSTSWPDYIYAFSPDKVFMMGDPQGEDFELYTSLNAGIDWEKVDSANIPNALSNEFGFNNAADVYGSNIWFSTNIGRLFHSEDEGNSWEVFDTPANTFGIEKVSFSDESNGIIAESYFNAFPYTSKLLHTSDGGNSWTDILPSFDPFFLLGFEYIPNSSNIIVGISRGDWVNGPFETWMSSDRGNSWQQISSGERIVWPTFQDTIIGWAGEYQQVDHSTQLFKYTVITGLLTKDILDVELSLSPNPTAGSLLLEIKATQASNFLVLLNDSQGKLMNSEMVNNVLNFQLQFNLASYPAGIYTVSITSKKGHVSHQVVKQ